VTASISVPDAEGEPVVGVTVYRIAQEAVTNAYRQGEGAAAVDVHEAGGQIHVSVENRTSHTLRGAVVVIVGLTRSSSLKITSPRHLR
jgi:signal transduction histidine kinase